MRLWHKCRLTGRILVRTLPAANAELRRWSTLAAAIPAPLLRAQALSSLRRKAFHAQGGATLAAALPDGSRCRHLVSFIVALQVLVDYLDNLCDRCGGQSQHTMDELHQAVTDAVDPARPQHEYYATFPAVADGGYLQALVAECRRRLTLLPDYAGETAAEVQHLAALYRGLQIRKHLPPGEREAAVRDWLAPLGQRYPELYWWELAAACGSTLGIFALCAHAAEPGNSTATSLVARAYFPWISAWHILLDYLIDLAEDQEFADFNFVSCYADLPAAADRLCWLQDAASVRLARLPTLALHELIVSGLPGLYLSDPKANQLLASGTVNGLLMGAGIFGRATGALCRLGVVHR